MSSTGYVVTGGGGGGTVSWGDVQSKPTEFPPEDHTHDYATEVTGKPATFPPSAHTHDYAASGHTHTVAYADVTGKPSTFPPDTHTHAYADITGKPSTFWSFTHTHAQSEVTGLVDALAEPARVYVHNGTSYVLSTTTDIYVGPSDPGSGTGTSVAAMSCRAMTS